MDAKRRYLSPDQPVGNTPTSVRPVAHQDDEGFENPWLNEALKGPEKLPPYFRTTSTVFPISSDVAKLASIPLGYVITPGIVDAPPVVDYTHGRLVKCNKCSAFLCPWSKVSSDGKHWTCALCGYTSIWVGQGSLSDRVERTAQVVDVVGGGVFDHLPNAGPAFVFMFDVSYDSLAAGFTQSAAQSLSLSLGELDDDVRVGLITVGHCLCVFDLDKKRQVAMPDFDEIDVRMSPSRLGDVRQTLLACLREIADLNPGKKPKGHCYGTGLEAASVMLQNIGGIVMAFVYGRPTVGPRAVPGRSKDELLRECSLLKMPKVPVSLFYRELAFALSKESISVHLFVASSEFADMAVMSLPSCLTNGKSYYYGDFAPRFRQILHNDIYRTISTRYFWDTSFRYMTSRGLVLRHMYGNCVFRDRDVVQVGALAPTDSFAADFLVEPHITSGSVVFQFALSWRNSDHQRMLRIFTFSLEVTEDPLLVAGNIDEGALAALYMQKTVFKLILNGPKGAMSSLSSEVRSVPIARFKSIPQLAYGIMKGRLLESKYVTGPDGRMGKVSAIRCYSITDTLLYIYPRLISVTSGDLKVLTLEATQDEPLLILHTVDVIYIWSDDRDFLHAQLRDSLSQEGIVDTDKISCENADQIREIIQNEWKLSMRYLPVIAIAGRQEISQYFIEHKVDAAFSYALWIQHGIPN